MKPESHHALMELISYGVEELSSEDATKLLAVVNQCPECIGQWVLFQKTYTVLSQSADAHLSVERSQQMWLTCLSHFDPTQSPQAAHSGLKPQSEVVPVSFRSDSSPREGDWRTPSASPFPSPFLNHLPYAVAAGALVLLLAAYLAPTPFHDPDASRLARPSSLPDASRLAPKGSFRFPPHATTGLIDYHSAMGFEPFSDHLAPSLLATGATRP